MKVFSGFSGLWEVAKYVFTVTASATVGLGVGKVVIDRARGVILPREESPDEEVETGTSPSNEDEEQAILIGES